MSVTTKMDIIAHGHTRNLLKNSTCMPLYVAHRRRLLSSRKESMICKVGVEDLSSPKAGVVGEDRFKDNAPEGTYWAVPIETAEKVQLIFNMGSEEIEIEANVGENLLKVAERNNILVPTIEFCFEGSCCLCEMEVEGGAYEVGYRSDRTKSDLVRTCICPVPSSEEPIVINVLSENDAWSSSVL